MDVILNILLLLIGFVALLKGADFLVDGAVGIARKFRIPTLVIGMTIVAFGTSAPEAAVSITAALNGNNAISVSNVIGSNIFNLMFIGGICGAYRTIPVKRIAITRDYPFHLVITTAFLVLLWDSLWGTGNALTLSRGDGIILLILMGIYMYINICDGIHGDESEVEEDKNFSLWKSLLLFAIGIAGVIIGGQLVVNSSTFLARFMGISDTLIGLTVVALGTSLPELVTSVVASKKGEIDLAWGNIIGSNIFNILFVLGISAFIKPMTIDILSIYDTIFLLAASLAIYPAIFSAKKVNRITGISMIILYAAYLAYIIIR